MHIPSRYITQALVACAFGCGGTVERACPPGQEICDLVCCVICVSDADCPADDVFCNGTFYCDGQLCLPRPRDCEDDVSCTLDSCNELDGRCEHQPDSTRCAVGQVCHVERGCEEGPPPNLCNLDSHCEDANPCTADICVDGACTNQPDDTLSCEDGVFCNGAEMCSGGVCVSGGAPSCNDGVGCTKDYCDEVLGACDRAADNSLCLPGQICLRDGDCQPSAVECTTDADCSDDDDCTDALCGVGGYCEFPSVRVRVAWYVDQDSDSFGDPAITAGQLCVAPGANWVQNSGDCDDNPLSCGDDCHPGATEVCDNYDNDCARGIDDGLVPIADDNVQGECVDNIKVCTGAGGYQPDPANYSPEAERCDDLDNDCSGADDDGCDDDGDDYCDSAMTVVGVPQVCLSSAPDTGDDCDDADDQEHPGQQWYPDADGDGYGDATATPNACERLFSTDVLDDTDCDDLGPCGGLCYPGNAEVCDGYDNDCSGIADDSTTCNVPYDVSGLVAYYRFEDADPFPDSLAVQANGTSIGSFIDQNFPGKLGSAAWTFDGSSSFVQIPDHDIYASPQMSIAAWVRLDVAEPSLRVIVGQQGNVAGYAAWALMKRNDVSPAGSFVFDVNPGGSSETLVVASATGAPLANTWYHVVGTYDGASLKIYVNGTLENNVAHTGAIMNGAYNPYIAAYNIAGAYAWPGQIDELSIWRRALDAPEVEALWNSGSGRVTTTLPDTSGLLAYYDFEQVSGSLLNRAVPTLTNNATPASLGILPSDQDDYSSSAGWTQVGTLVTVNATGAGLVRLQDANTNEDHRVYRALAAPLPSAWTIEVEYLQLQKISDSNHPIVCLTAGTGEPAYAAQDAVCVNIHWQGTYAIDFKDDGAPYQNVAASLSGIRWNEGRRHYFQLSRTSPASVRLRVFADAEHAVELPGSPFDRAIPASITGLNVVQHGARTGDGITKTLTAELDNLRVFAGHKFLPLGRAADGMGYGVTTAAASAFGSSFAFGGGSDHVNVSSRSFGFLHNTTASATMNLWYKLAAVDWGTAAYLAGTSSGSATIGMEIKFFDDSSDHAVLVQVVNGAGNQQVASTFSPGFLPKDTNWHMLTVTWDVAPADKNLRVCMDGAVCLVDNKWANAPTEAAASYPLHIGLGGNGLEPFVGQVDEVSIWSRPLTLTEIANLYAGGNGVNLLQTTPLPRSCLEHRSGGASTNGVYVVDPDGTGGDSPFDVYCNMTTDGGGWTMWGSVTLTAMSSSGLIMPSANAYMNTSRYAALRSSPPSAFMARAQISGEEYYLSAAEAASGNCHDLTDPAPEVESSPLRWYWGHKESAGCDLNGSDYAGLELRDGFGIRIFDNAGVTLWHFGSPLGPTNTTYASQGTVGELELYIR